MHMLRMLLSMVRCLLQVLGCASLRPTQPCPVHNRTKTAAKIARYVRIERQVKSADLSLHSNVGTQTSSSLMKTHLPAYCPSDYGSTR
jgi:hypothetical protein